MNRTHFVVVIGAFVLTLGSTSSAHATFTKVKETTHVGKFQSEQPRMTRWTADFTAPPHEIDRALRTWNRVGPLMGKNTDFKVRTRTKRTATMWFEKDGPFFIPRPTIVMRAVSTFDEKTRRGESTWTIVEGVPKQLRLHWTIEPKGTGSRVSFASVVEVPALFAPFLADNMKEEMRKNVLKFKRFVGATAVSAPSAQSPVGRQHPSTPLTPSRKSP